MEKVRLPPVDEEGGQLRNDGAGAGAVGPTHGGKRSHHCASWLPEFGLEERGSGSYLRRW